MRAPWSERVSRTGGVNCSGEKARLSCAGQLCAYAGEEGAGDGGDRSVEENWRKLELRALERRKRPRAGMREGGRDRLTAARGLATSQSSMSSRRAGLAAGRKTIDVAGLRITTRLTNHTTRTAGIMTPNPPRLQGVAACLSLFDSSQSPH